MREVPASPDAQARMRAVDASEPSANAAGEPPETNEQIPRARLSAFREGASPPPDAARQYPINTAIWKARHTVIVRSCIRPVYRWFHLAVIAAQAAATGSPAQCASSASWQQHHVHGKTACALQRRRTAPPSPMRRRGSPDSTR